MVNEERMMAVFDAVAKYVQVGEYTVVPKSNIREDLTDFTQREIDSSVNTLQVNGLLEVKYVDAEVYCVGVLPKGVLEREKREKARQEAERLAARLAAEEEARKAALAAGETPPARLGEDGEEVPEEKEETPPAQEEEKGVYLTKKDLKKFSLLYMIPACLGLLLGLISLIYVIAKVK